MPIKILYLIETLGAGGAERMLYSCLKYLDRDRFDAVVCPLYERPDHWRQPILDLGYPVLSPGLSGRWDWRAGLLGLPRLLENHPFDLIHAQLYSANLYGRFLGRRRGIPVVTSIQNVDYEPEVLEDDAAIGPLKLAVLRHIDRWTGRRYGARWIAVSEYVRASAMKRLGIPEGRIELVFNSIDLAIFRPPDEPRRQEIRRELGVASGEQVLLSVGRLHPQKGHRYLLRALPLVLRRFPGARLLLAGGGNQRFVTELRDLAESLGIARRIEFLGTRGDIADLMGSCDLFVFPSLYEGLSLALVEALATGTACVASDIVPNREVIEQGTTGSLVDPRRTEDLSEAICSLLADPDRRAAIGQAGREDVARRFDVARNIGRIESLYEAIVHDSPRRR